MVLVAATFSLNATLKEKEAQTTSGTFRFHPSRVSHKGQGAPCRITPSVPLTQLGFWPEQDYKLQDMTLVHTGSSDTPPTEAFIDNHLLKV